MRGRERGSWRGRGEGERERERERERGEKSAEGRSSNLLRLIKCNGLKRLLLPRCPMLSADMPLSVRVQQP